MHFTKLFSTFNDLLLFGTVLYCLSVYGIKHDVAGDFIIQF